MAKAIESAPAAVTLLSVRAAARILDLNVRTLHRHVKAGRIAAIWVGARLKIRRDELDRVLTEGLRTSAREA